MRDSDNSLPDPWRDLVARQQARLWSDLPARLLAATSGFGLAAVILPLAWVGLLFALYALSEVFQAVLLHDRNPLKPRLRYAAFLANSLMGVSGYAGVAVLLLQTSGAMVQSAGVIYLAGGLVNTAVTRSRHLPLGLVTATPLSLALLVLPVESIWMSGADAEAVFSLAAAIVLIGYFYWVIVDYNRLEARIEQSQAAAAQESLAKSRFLAEMSHDIRTPMNAINGVTQLLRDRSKAISPDAVALLEESSQVLQMVIDDAVLVAEGPATHLPQPQPVQIAREFRLWLDRLRGPAEHRGIDISLKLDTGLPTSARFDPVLVRRCCRAVLAQILSEAGPGSLVVGVRLVPSVGKPELHIHFAYCSGIAPGKTGCGLAEARQIAATLGGRIDWPANGSPDQAVRLVLPVDPVAAAPAVRGPLRALVVDDIATNRFIVVHLLQAAGIGAAEVDSGAAALAHLSQERFDVVLLDMNMPQMNGATVFQAIRASGTRWADVPVIALTADALAEQRAAYLALGLSGYVAKPVDRVVLLSEIDRVTDVA